MDSNIDSVKRAIKESWSQETAYLASDWSEDNPARGQCVVSALVLQDYVGGILKKYKVVYNDQIEGHYTNLLSSGVEVDATRDQYPNDITFQEAEIDLKGHSSLREKLFSKANTKKRYALLKEEVEGKLATNS